VVPYLVRKLKKEGDAVRAARKSSRNALRHGDPQHDSGIPALPLESRAWWWDKTRGSRGGWGFRLLAAVTLTAGTAFLMWRGADHRAGHQATAFLSLFSAGHRWARRCPKHSWVIQTMGAPGTAGPLWNSDLLAFMIAVWALLCVVERGQRRIPVQYAKRVVGRRMYGGQTTIFPSRSTRAGVIPPFLPLPSSCSGRHCRTS